MFYKIFSILFFLLGSVFICQAAPFGTCNYTLDADYIRSGGGNYGSIDCDVVGKLTIDNKDYTVFEYIQAGYGQVILGAMEQGYTPEPINFNHILDITIVGLNDNSHAGRLSDNERFRITISKAGVRKLNKRRPIFSLEIMGKCQEKYDNTGKKRSTDLEFCQGAGWSLMIAPKPQAYKE